MTTAEHLVAVLLGTDHHPFPRLTAWVGSHATTDDATRWFLQHGSTPPPPGVAGARLLRPRAMAALLERADVVVTHGGPGLIMEAIDAGHRPVVVPRRARLGEHVDDHQVRFARRMAESGAVVAVDDTASLDAAVRGALRAGRPGRRPSVARPGNAETARRFGVLVEDLLRGA